MAANLQDTMDLSRFDPTRILRTAAALSEYEGEISELKVDPSKLTPAAATGLASYLRRAKGLKSLLLVRVATDEITDLERQVVGRMVDALLEAATENDDLTLHVEQWKDAFNYGALPAATPEIFHRFANAKLQHSRVRITVDSLQRAALQDTLQGVQRLGTLHLRAATSAAMESITRTLRRSNIELNLLSLSLRSLEVDVSSLMSNVPPGIRGLMLVSGSLARLQYVMLPPNRTLKRLDLWYTHPPREVLPFRVLEQITFGRIEDQPERGARWDRAVQQCLLQLFDNNLHSLKKVYLIGVPTRLFKSLDERLLDLVQSQLTILGMQPDREFLRRLCPLLPKSNLDKLVISEYDLSADDVAQLLAVAGHCTALQRLELFNRPPSATVVSVLLPLVRANNLAPAVVSRFGEYHAEVSFYNAIHDSRRLLSSPGIANGLWAHLFAWHANNETVSPKCRDKIPTPWALYFLLRAKVDLVCESLVRGLRRERDSGDEGE